MGVARGGPGVLQPPVCLYVHMGVARGGPGVLQPPVCLYVHMGVARGGPGVLQPPVCLYVHMGVARGGTGVLRLPVWKSEKFSALHELMANDDFVWVFDKSLNSEQNFYHKAEGCVRPSIHVYIGREYSLQY